MKYEKYSVIEPFIILPYGKRQDILYYSSQSLKPWEEKLLELVYKDRGNLVVKDNLIKVIYDISHVLILHIYPTAYKEKGSRRGGQNLVIGFLVCKSEILRSFDQTIQTIALFFRGIEKFMRRDVQLYFVNHINECNDQKLIREHLETLRQDMLNIMPRSTKNFLKEAFMGDRWLIRRSHKYYFNLKTGSAYEKLELVYKVIQWNCWHVGVTWIVVNDADPEYYNMKSAYYIYFNQESGDVVL